MRNAIRACFGTLMLCLFALPAAAQTASPPVLDWFKANGPVILGVIVVVLPSLITGLSPYPRASGFVYFLRTILSLVSVLTHSDSPGTLKLPLTLPKDPSDAPLPSLRGFARVGLLAGVALMVSAVGCAWFKASTIADLEACGAKTAGAAGQLLLGDVAAILNRGDINYRDQLAALVNVVGSDGVQCAILVLLGDFQVPAPSSGSALVSAPQLTSDGIVRARAYRGG